MQINSPQISDLEVLNITQDINPHWQEEALIVLELLKSGYFTNAFVLEEGGMSSCWRVVPLLLI